ncbi:hypothetical protein BDV96DRAFT_651854 [Lophiotrema nucula]|uniref:Rhodopsin domain-containing protein n=1 Tax=Lophiotrema nucula TaxID=690887 RepID=A0A6A5YQK0_9PLEO|nr:hypothetical protein BDV96DRAFT_651854 [Lophiotrema nucula]
MAETEGRISKAAFIGTSSAFLGLCLIATTVRCYIRFRIQREFGWDDAILIFGLCCLISGMALLFTVIDTMYQAESLVFGSEGFAAIASMNISEIAEQSARYHIFSTAALVLMWFSICSVKFCFLAFFRKLIRQMPTMIMYWWIVLSFNIAATVYGVTIYLAGCPYFRADQMLQTMSCVQGSKLKLSINLSTSQMALDIAGDLFILVIPILLIWKIRINWTQKAALALTLCLTIIMVIITIARIAGLKWKGKVDLVWECYFIVIAAEVGLALVSITAFRALYISKTKNRDIHDTITSFRWYKSGKTVAWKIITMTTGKTPTDSSKSLRMERRGSGFLKDDIPHGTMTGMRTFIDGNGKTRLYATMDEEV